MEACIVPDWATAAEDAAIVGRAHEPVWSVRHAPGEKYTPRHAAPEPLYVRSDTGSNGRAAPAASFTRIVSVGVTLFDCWTVVPDWEEKTIDPGCGVTW